MAFNASQVRKLDAPVRRMEGGRSAEAKAELEAAIGLGVSKRPSRQSAYGWAPDCSSCCFPSVERWTPFREYLPLRTQASLQQYNDGSVIRLRSISRRTASSVVLMLDALVMDFCAKRLDRSIPLAALHATDRSADFADLFCTLLALEKRPDGKNWGSCSGWLEKARPHRIAVPLQIPASYRFLLIAGFGSECIQGPNATFTDAIRHLQQVQSYTAETLSVLAFGSSNFNG